MDFLSRLPKTVIGRVTVMVVQRMKFILVRAVVGLAMSLPSIAGVLPDRLSLTYTLEYRGIPLGTLEKTLSRDGEVYLFASRAAPTGLGRLVTSDTVDESGEFEVRDGIVRPLRYAIVQSGKKGYDRQVRFDWAQGKLVFENSDRQEAALPDYTQDAGSIVFALMLHGPPDGEQVVHLTDGKQVKQYTIRPDGREVLDTPIGRLDTVRVARERPDRDQSTIIWLAVDRHNLPVKIEKRKNGMAESALLIESVSGLQ
jgi:hypothetical protein